MALTSAERQRRYRERLKSNNPDKWEEIKKKDAEKKKKNYVRISQLSEIAKDKKRKLWRQLKQKKEKQKPNTKDKTTSRKVYKQRYYKITKENQKQKRKISILKKRVDSLRKKVYRYKLLLTCQQNEAIDEKENIEPTVSPTSPSSITESLVQTLGNVPSPEKNKIRRLILEKNVLNAKSNDERKVLKKVFDNSVVRQYKMKTQLGYCIGLKGRIRVRKNKRNSKDSIISKKIIEFYLQDNVTRATSGKKETKTVRKEKVQKRYLLDNLFNTHKKFKEETGINVSYTTFIRNKPFYVVSPKLSDRDTCACKKHANIEYKLTSLKRLSVLNGYKTIEEVVKSLVCSLESQECMYSECALCKPNKINMDISKTKLDDNVSWLEWSIKDIEYKKDDKVKKCKRNIKEIKTGSLQELITLFEKELDNFKIHLFNINHQYNMYKNMKDSIKANEVLVHCDFSENYTCKSFKEIQAVHFGASQFQISLHTSVVYQKQKKPQSFCTLSDSNDHSPEAIWAHLKPILTHIKEKAPQIDTVHFFSDGPTSQYKQKKNFFLFNNIIKDFALTGTWNFFEAAHGKGAADGVGGTIKRLLDRKVSYGKDIVDATSAYEAIKDETKVMLFYINESDITSIKKDNYNALLTLKAIHNTMKIHQIQSTNLTHIVASRILSCFCARSTKRGFCDCFSLQTNYLHILKRAKRIPSYTSSDASGDEKDIQKKRICNVGRSPPVTILSNVRVNYDTESLKTLLGTAKAYNISSYNLKEDFKDMTQTESDVLPSTSNCEIHNYLTENKKWLDFFNISDDSN